MIALAALSSAAFAPTPVLVQRPAPAAARFGTIVNVAEPTGRRAALFAGALAATTWLPAARAEVSEEVYQEEKAKALAKLEAQGEQEERSVIAVTAVSAIVLVSPIIGIQMARGAISKVSDEETKKGLKGRDPRSNTFQR